MSGLGPHVTIDNVEISPDLIRIAPHEGEGKLSYSGLIIPHVKGVDSLPRGSAAFILPDEGFWLGHHGDQITAGGSRRLVFNCVNHPLNSSSY